MPNPQRVQVSIFGRTYQLAGADPEYTRSLAGKVDETMSSFEQERGASSPFQIAILAALHIADELATAKRELEAQRSQADAALARIASILESGLAAADPEADAAAAGDRDAGQAPAAPPPSA